MVRLPDSPIDAAGAVYSTRNTGGFSRSPATTRALLTDPQTSGGLLAACAPAAVEEVLAVFRNEGFEHAAVVGEITAGVPHVVVD